MDETRNDAILVKFDSSGHTLWTKVWHSKEEITSISTTPDGGYIFATGQSVVRTDASGDILWQKSLQCYQVISSSDETFVVAGPISISKLNYNGESVWENFYGEVYLQYCSALLETRDRGYLIVAVMSTSNPVLIKTNFSGKIKWTWT